MKLTVSLCLAICMVAIAELSFGFSGSYPSMDNTHTQLLAKLSAASDTLQEYVGEYELAPGQRLTISLSNQKLYILPPGETAKAELKPVKAAEFIVVDEEARLFFKKDQAGKVQQVELRFGNGASATGKKIS